MFSEFFIIENPIVFKWGFCPFSSLLGLIFSSVHDCCTIALVQKNGNEAGEGFGPAYGMMRSAENQSISLKPSNSLRSDRMDFLTQFHQGHIENKASCLKVNSIYSSEILLDPEITIPYFSKQIYPFLKISLVIFRL